MEYKPGDKVRIEEGHDRIGLVENPDHTWFEPETVTSGDVGVYDGPHPAPRLAEDGWHLVRFTVDGRELFCPVPLSFLEPA